MSSNPAIVNVHLICRMKDYTNKLRLRPDQTGDRAFAHPKTKLRSEVELFHWKTHCVLCGKIGRDIKHPDRQNVGEVQTVSIDFSSQKICAERNDYLSLYVDLT